VSADRLPAPVRVRWRWAAPQVAGAREWVTATVARDHPYLRAAVFGPDAIGALFDTGGVALFLDGLDELPDADRSQAIHRLRTEAGGVLARTLNSPLTLSLARSAHPSIPHRCSTPPGAPGRPCAVTCSTRPWSPPTPTRGNVPAPPTGRAGSPTT
jgi:hypothetical protein